jgi:hypothetical protein
MENIRFIIKDYDKEALGPGNIIKCLISALSVNEDTVVQSYNQYSLGLYDTVLDDKFIYKGQTDKELERVETCRLLILRSEEEFQEDLPAHENWLGGLNNPKFHHLFSFCRRIDSRFEPEKIHPIVRDRIFGVIDKILFKPIIYEKVEKLSESFQTNITLAISIRTWKANHETDIHRQYDFNIYKDKILEVLNQHKEINKIVVSIDNHNYLQDYITFFEEHKLDYILLTKDDDMNDLQYSIVKALTMAKCKYCIGNRLSTYIELIYWFSRLKVNMYTVY